MVITVTSGHACLTENEITNDVSKFCPLLVKTVYAEPHAAELSRLCTQGRKHQNCTHGPHEAEPPNIQTRKLGDCHRQLLMESHELVKIVNVESVLNFLLGGLSEYVMPRSTCQAKAGSIYGSPNSRQLSQTCLIATLLPAPLHSTTLSRPSLHLQQHFPSITRVLEGATNLTLINIKLHSRMFRTSL